MLNKIECSDMLPQSSNACRPALKVSFPRGLDRAAPRQTFQFRRANLGDFQKWSFMFGQEDPICYPHRNRPPLKKNTVYGPMSIINS
jgi:hypothetical protein